MSTDSYLLENRAPDAGTRFVALSALFDGVTMRHVDGIGARAGWRCWEVGAGGPGVPRLLAERIGPTGYVLATDLDVSWMGTDLPGNVEVRRHDVATDAPPEPGFDLVHARLVLVHVPQRDEALRRMVAALRPGGWLLIEDFDVNLQPLACLEARQEAEQRANRVRAGFRELLAQRGVDLAYGRTLPRRLRDAGLTDVAADAFEPVALPAAAALEIANVRQVAPALISQARASAEEVDAHLRAVAAGQLDIATPPLISARGRHP
ncbi:methyltransferase family protein [Pseudonocardia hierapolitana]|uniref:Methyltransferase family protein n=1 Tax=Pseudonocardia hierapolitana TaxID=1128676 RepID=A0A561SH88_9PSEU|nr:methyltransferase domain-containing protein [Pseudonocardia hierapolitana]TWF74229.1 methyltransferase family protein [Pseudonocardia hierapolitana]